MMIDFVNKITFPSRKTFFDLKSYQTIPSVIGENGTTGSLQGTACA